MNPIVKEFFDNTRIPKNPDTEAIMEFLASPEAVNKMIVASQLNIPALSGVVRELEENFADSPEFPLHREGPGANAMNRRNVGWMIRYIMREYGYTPSNSMKKTKDENDEQDKSYTERTRLRQFTGTKYFSTSAVYKKTIDNPNHTITVLSK